jgi:hypothetical protein
MVEKDTPDTLVMLAPNREDLPDGIMTYYGSKRKAKTETKELEEKKDFE